jgi:molybdopterin-guanine dinucleotide biosynthesis protein A
MIRDIDGFVLTGGASQRMGRDKSGLQFGACSLAIRAHQVLSAISQNVCAAGNKSLPGFTNTGDILNPGSSRPRASIVGLHSALFHSHTEWTAVLACDLPFVTEAFFQRLVGICESVGELYDAVVPVQQDGRTQPLAALYRRDRCIRSIEQMIGGGNYRLSAFVENLNAYRVLPSEFSDLDEPERLFFNINTPEDYTNALELADVSSHKA